MGFGTAGLGDWTRDMVLQAIRAGYRRLDTAQVGAPAALCTACGWPEHGLGRHVACYLLQRPPTLLSPSPHLPIPHLPTHFRHPMHSSRSSSPPCVGAHSPGT
jgi:hypothetical protein